MLNGEVAAVPDHAYVRWTLRVAERSFLFMSHYRFSRGLIIESWMFPFDAAGTARRARSNSPTPLMNPLRWRSHDHRPRRREKSSWSQRDSCTARSPAMRIGGRLAPRTVAQLAVRRLYRVPESATRPPTLPSGGTGFTATFEGHTVRGTWWGAGPVVYLLHGWAGGAGQWIPSSRASLGVVSGSSSSTRPATEPLTRGRQVPAAATASSSGRHSMRSPPYTARLTPWSRTPWALSPRCSHSASDGWPPTT